MQSSRNRHTVDKQIYNKEIGITRTCHLTTIIIPVIVGLLRMIKKSDTFIKKITGTLSIILKDCLGELFKISFKIIFTFL